MHIYIYIYTYIAYITCPRYASGVMCYMCFKMRAYTFHDVWYLRQDIRVKHHISRVG